MQTKEQKISPIKQRILYFASTLGISKREFYSKIEVSRGTLESPTGITEEVMAKFIATFPSVNSDWLLTGRGEMLKTTCTPMAPLSDNDSPLTCLGEDKKNDPINQTFTTDIIKKTPPKKEPAYRVTDGSNNGIPLIPIDAMAGALVGEQTILEYECERYVVPLFKGADFLIPVKGSSMYPKYSSGDIVACQRVPMSDLFFQWNKVYVIDTNQGALIKRIKPGSTPHNILIVSDNEKYDPFELSISAIHAVALVIGVIRLE